MADKSQISISGTTYRLRDDRIPETVGKTIVAQINDVLASKSDVTKGMDSETALFTINGKTVHYKDDITLESNTAVGSRAVLNDENGSPVLYGDVVDGVEEFGTPKVHPHMYELSQVRDSALYGKKLVCMGDSYIDNDNMSNLYSWWLKLGQKYDMEYFNFGVNGATTIAYGDNRLFDRFKDICEDLAQQFVQKGYVTATDVSRASQYDKDSDNYEVWTLYYGSLFKDVMKDQYVVITGGRNDHTRQCHYRTTLGNIWSGTGDASYEGVGAHAYDGKYSKDETYVLDGTTAVFNFGKDTINGVTSVPTDKSIWTDYRTDFVASVFFKMVTNVFPMSHIMWLLAQRQDNLTIDKVDSSDSYNYNAVAGRSYNKAQSQFTFNRRIQKSASKYGVKCFNPWEGCVVRPWLSKFKANYQQNANDISHINDEGADLFLSVMENNLMEA